MISDRRVTVWEQLESVLSDLDSFVAQLPEEQRAEGQEHLRALRALIDVLDTDLAQSPVATGVSLPKDKIERLGLGPEIIRLRPRMTITQLAEHFNLSEETIRRFLRRYDQMKASEKSRLRSSSVFDVFDRLEELAAMIYRQLAILEAQPETHVKYIAELRQVLDLAARLTKDLYTIRKYEEFKKAVVDILMQELPHRRAEVQQRLAMLASTLPKPE